MESKCEEGRVGMRKEGLAKSISLERGEVG
jgi:hypothetical protein